MTPTLPADDPNAERRGRELRDAQDDYAFDWSYQGIAAVVSLPLRDRSDLRWWAAVADRVLAVERNALRGTLSDGAAALEGAVREHLVEALPEVLRRHRAPKASPTAPSSDPLAPWRELYRTLPVAPVVSTFGSDAAFARQFLAGPNPVVIERLTGSLPHFRVGPEHLAAAVGDDDTFDRALAEGRLYLADYRRFDGLPAGVVDGLQKYVFAPMAAFVYSRSQRALVPFAIQLGQQPSRIWTPRDGGSWAMAKTAVASADGNDQGIVSHFALCHQVMESVILSARRQLSERHPLRVLLEPHFRDTLITNEIAKSALVGPDGNMDRLQSPTLDASLSVARAAIDDFRLLRASPPEDFASRGVDDAEALPDYPARDDAAPLWEAMRDWVTDYVRLYYVSDAAVAGDTELRAFVHELGSDDGGRLRGVVPPNTVDEVAALVSRIVYRCTGWHAQFNYTSYDLFSYAPALPTASFAAGPTGGEAADAWLSMLPPPALAADVMGLFWQITVQLTALGGYPDDAFDDPRVAPLLATHRDRLATVERDTTARDAARPSPWPYLLPSRVPLSIHV